MSGIAGRRALVKVTGAPVVFTDEAAADSGDHKTYQITNTVKRVWDRATTLVVKVGGTPTAEVYTFNRLNGKVTFATINAGRGAVTLTGAYLPLVTAVGAYNYSYSITKQPLDDTDFDAAFAGFKTYQSGMLDIEGTVGRRLSIDTTFRDALIAGVPVVIQFFSDRSATADVTAWAYLDKDAITAAMDGLQDGSVDFKGTGDDQGVAVA